MTQTALARPTILYVAGCFRSGTTLLGNVLGEIDGFFSAGELVRFWQWIRTDTQMCGCGKTLQTCPLWSAVLDALGTRADDSNARCLAEFVPRLWEARQVPLTVSLRLWSPYRRELELLADYAESLYAAIAQVTGCSVVVDHSKTVTYAYPLQTLTDLDIRVVHIVRDARGVVHSFRRRKPIPGIGKPRYTVFMPLFRSLPAWMVWNGAAEVLLGGRGADRYMRLRYEDFIAHPQTTLERILAMLDRSGAALPLIDDHSVRLGTNHTVGGNPMRMHQGVVPLRTDDAWMTEMPKRDRAVVTSVASAALRHYGYTLGTRARL